MTGPELEPRYRMPVSFGPAPGPRNLPAAVRHRRYTKQIHTITLAAVSDAGMLADFLPEGLALAGEPRIEVALSCFRDIGWLAGRGYNILMVRIPVTWREVGEVAGHFVPVVWESMADPIITGRDELGWPKIFADIPDPQCLDGEWTGQACWDGHTFFDFTAAQFAPCDTPPAGGPMVFRKYVPRTGRPGEADADCLTMSVPDGPPAHLEACSAGEGRFAFHPATWEQMPTQYPIANALAALPLYEFRPAVLTAGSGGGDGSLQRELRLAP